MEKKKMNLYIIAGCNGAGKTTFLNCLANLVPLDKGEIFIDDKNIKKIPPREVAKVIGYVPQIIVPSFDFSVLEYVVTGCAPHMGTLSRPKQEHYDIAMEAIKRMGIEKLTNRSYSQISGGERQRLSIARAVLKNPSILFFDEATASVDVQTEKKIQKAIKNLAGQRTIIAIAHRLSTIVNADNIIVMNEGKIIETGRHTELLSKDGFYANLYNSQFSSES